MKRWLAPAIFGLTLTHCRGDPTAPSLATTTVAAPPTASKTISVDPSTRPTRLPEGCSLVARLDLRALLENPVLGARWFVPEELEASPSREARSFDEMLRELDLSPKRDLRDLRLCLDQQERQQRFVAVLTGDLPSGIVGSVERHDPGREKFRVVRLAEHSAIERGGKFLVQAADRSLVFGDDPALVSGALTERPDGYRVPRKGEIAIVIGRMGAAGPELVRDLERGEIVFELAERNVSVKLAFLSEAARANYERDLESLLLGSARELERAPAEFRSWLLPWLEALRHSRPEGKGTAWAIDVRLAPGVMESTLERLLGMAVRGGMLD